MRMAIIVAYRKDLETVEFQEKVREFWNGYWVATLDHLNMSTAVEWDVKPQTKPQKQALVLGSKR